MDTKISNEAEELQSENESVIKNPKTKEKVFYGMGGIALNLLLGTASGFIMYFYTDIVGIGAAIVGTILFFGRIFDGVSDITMGLVVDKTKSKHGKSRPWLLWMSVPFGLSLILLFVSPDFGDTGKIIYAFLTYTLATAIIYTATAVPHASLLSTMTQSQRQRGQLSIIKTAFNSMSGILIGVITLPLVALFGGGEQGWLLMAITYGALSTMILLLVFKNTSERTTLVTNKNKTINKIPLKDNFKSLIKNKYWLIVTVIALMVAFMMGLNGGAVYYAEQVLGNAMLVGPINAASGLPIIITLILIGPLMKRFSKRNLAMTGFFLTGLGAVVMLINPESLLFVMIGKAIAGAALPLPAVTLIAMLADTVEYGEWKTGLRNEGALFGAESMAMKVGLGLGVMILGWLLGLAGYVGGQATQAPEVLFVIKFVNIHLVIIISIIAMIILYFYKLDKEYPQIIAELKERKSK